MTEFNIGQQFSSDPQGRFYSDGDFSGEEFREEHLWPLLTKLGEGEKLTIILDDGVEGYGSSFLTEGFAGVVKYGYLTADDLLEKLDLICTDEDFKFYKRKIVEYINAAKFKSSEYQSTKSK